MVKIPQKQEYYIHLAHYYVMTLVLCLCWKEGSEFLEGRLVPLTPSPAEMSGRFSPLNADASQGGATIALHSSLSQDSAKSLFSCPEIIQQLEVLVTAVTVNRLGYILSLTAIMYTASITRGLVQESIFQDPDFKFPFLQTFIEKVVYALLAFGTITCVPRDPTDFRAYSIFRRPLAQQPYRLYIAVASLSVLSTALGYAALEHVSYSIKLIIRSSKLIPSLIIGSLLLQKKYHHFQWIAALCLVAGLVIFTVAEATVAFKFSYFGLLLLVLGLLVGAGVPVAQEHLSRDEMGKPRPVVHPRELLFATNVIGGLLSLVPALLSAELPSFVWYLRHLSSEGRLFPFVISILSTTSLGYVASYGFAAMIKKEGAGSALVLGLLRRFLSIVLSFAFFPKPVTVWHGIGTLMVLGSVYGWVQGATLLEKTATKEEELLPK